VSDNVISNVDFGRSPPARDRYDWEAIALQLRQRPGEWALVFEHGKTSIANAIRQGGIASLQPEAGFEVRTTNNKREPMRTCTLWLRWNPRP